MDLQFPQESKKLIEKREKAGKISKLYPHTWIAQKK
jgi:hypothetical protein